MRALRAGSRYALYGTSAGNHDPHKNTARGARDALSLGVEHDTKPPYVDTLFAIIVDTRFLDTLDPQMHGCPPRGRQPFR